MQLPSLHSQQHLTFCLAVTCFPIPDELADYSHNQSLKGLTMPDMTIYDQKGLTLL